MIAAKYAPLLSGFILSGLMSLLVSGISTLRINGLDAGFLQLWLGSWLMAWTVAFPCVLVVAPLTRCIVQGLMRH